MTPQNELRLNEGQQEVRAWNLSAREIRREGALFNLYKGATFAGLETPM
jgi:hypothetical protein